MKLTLLLIFVASLQVSANVNGQVKVSLKARQVEISKVLNAIERQGTYRFLYNSRLNAIQKKVNIDVTDMGIGDVLQDIFEETDLTYKILDNNLIVILSNTLALQDIRITGKVTGENGEALSGVSVSLKGTAIGTATDNNGNFTLTVPEKGTLVISYIGYQSQEVAINSQAVVNVKLLASNKAMDEVVVIGYGTASKRDLTGSIVKVSGKEITDKPNINPIASLQGKVAGLSVVNTGTPGAAPDIRIRGTISIGQVHPLYVVDGIFNTDISFLNPNDIESIEILKDPSSLAIFGVKGAAGVIAITTKRAKSGQAVVNFNTSLGIKQMVDQIQMANGDEFRKILTMEGQNRFFDNGYTTINNFVQNDLSKWTGNTDWIKAVTRTAYTTANNISVAASTDRNRFYMSAGYTTDQGLVKGTNYDKIVLSFADEYKLNKIFKVGFNVNGSRESLPYDGNPVLTNARQVAPIVNSATKTFYTHNPYGGPTDSANFNLYSGMPTIQNTLDNPLSQQSHNWNKTIDPKSRVVGSVYLEFNFLKNFNFRATGYLDMATENKRAYTPVYDQYDPDPFPGTSPIIHKSAISAVNQDITDFRNYQTDFILNYKKQLGDHSITATGGFTTTYGGAFNTHGQIQQAAGTTPIPDDKRFWYLSTGFGDATTLRATSYQNEATTVSGLARVLYNYKTKYFLTASFRRDGASQINGNYDKKFQNFWAVGGAWEMTREKFMDNQHFFDVLKLKGSTGILGNANVTVNGSVQPYPYYPAITSGSSAVFGNHVASAYTTSYLPDPILRWERVRSTEAGFEFTAMQNRLHFEALYYEKLTKDLLVLLQTPGVQPTLTNNGEISNKGFEFSAGWNQVINKDFSFAVNGNLTTYQNKVLSIGYPLYADPQYPNQTIAGQPISYFVGYEVIGLYQSYADILNSPKSNVNGQGVAPGDFKYKDISGTNGKGGPDNVINSGDLTKIGNPTPKFAYGGAIDANYRSFSLNIGIGGVYGNQIYRYWATSEQQNSLYNYPKYAVNAWHGAGTSNWVPITDAQHLNNRAPSSYGIEDGSYIRIRNIQLAYNVSPQSLQRAHIKTIRIFVNVQNLKTWKHNLGYSPEYGGSATYDSGGHIIPGNNSATSFGIDVGDASGVIPRIWSGGVNVTF